MPASQSRPMPATPVALAPVPADDRKAAMEICASIGATMETLLQLIEAESVLLRAGKPIVATLVAARKRELAAAYLVDLDVLREIGVELAAFAPEAVDRLRQLHEEFVSVLQIDMATLATVRATAEPQRRPPQRQAIARPSPRAESAGRPEQRRIAAASR